MMGINSTVKKISTLIESRQNARHTIGFGPTTSSPLRMIGEAMLNKFAGNISSAALLAEQNEHIQEEILENIISSFALAGMLGMDLEKDLENLLDLLEAVSAEAS